MNSEGRQVRAYILSGGNYALQGMTVVLGSKNVSFLCIKQIYTYST